MMTGGPVESFKETPMEQCHEMRDHSRKSLEQKVHGKDGWNEKGLGEKRWKALLKNEEEVGEMDCNATFST